MIIIVFSLLTCLIYSHATLSKLDKKSSPKEKAKTILSIEKRNLVKEVFDVESYSQNAYLYCKSTECMTKKFSNKWNKKGYEYAKIFSNKIDYLSPVWYVVKPNCNIETFMDKTWFDEFPRDHTKIVPRFKFEEWDANAYKMLKDEYEIQKCVDKISHILQQFDGLVLEIWHGDTFLSKTKSIKFIKSLSESIHSANKMLFFVIPPPFYNETNGYLITPGDIEPISAMVDGFSINTYDYSDNLMLIGPISPYEWIRKCIQTFINGSTTSDIRSKLYIGLNFYGNDYSLSAIERMSAGLKPNTDVIPARKIINHEYVHLLKTYHPQCQWIEDWKEHLCRYTNSTNKDVRALFYPTLYSISQRLKLAEELDVNVAIWELGQALDIFFELL